MWGLQHGLEELSECETLGKAFCAAALQGVKGKGGLWGQSFPNCFLGDGLSLAKQQDVSGDSLALVGTRQEPWERKVNRVSLLPFPKILLPFPCAPVGIGAAGGCWCFPLSLWWL